MKNIFFVKASEFETAKNMEKKLLSLPKDTSILFASVTVQEGEERPTYRIVIGCSRDWENNLVHAIARKYLREFVEVESQLQVEVHRGVARTD